MIWDFSPKFIHIRPDVLLYALCNTSEDACRLILICNQIKWINEVRWINLKYAWNLLRSAKIEFNPIFPYFYLIDGNQGCYCRNLLVRGPLNMGVGMISHLFIICLHIPQTSNLTFVTFAFCSDHYSHKFEFVNLNSFVVIPKFSL